METNKCANCRQELDVGVDARRSNGGVFGVKGFVPLEKPLFFCSDECEGSYFYCGSLPNVPKRIP